MCVRVSACVCVYTLTAMNISLFMASTKYAGDEGGLGGKRELSRKANDSASLSQNLKFQHRATPLKERHCVYAKPNFRTRTRPKNKAPFHTTSLPLGEKIQSGSDFKECWEPHLNAKSHFPPLFFSSLYFETGQLSVCLQPPPVWLWQGRCGWPLWQLSLQ